MTPFAPSSVSAHAVEVQRSEVAFLEARLALARQELWRQIWLPPLEGFIMLLPAWVPGVLLAVFGDVSLEGWRFLAILLLLPFSLVLVLGLFAWVFLPSFLWSLGQMVPRLVQWGMMGVLQGPLIAALRSEAGLYPRARYIGSRWRHRAIRALIQQDGQLVETPEGVRLLGGFVFSCPSCGAPWQRIGPGLRRCAHCSYGQFEPPDPVSPTARSAHTEDLSPWWQAAFPEDSQAELRRAGVAYLVHGVTLFLSLRLHSRQETLADIAALVTVVSGLAAFVMVAVSMWTAIRVTLERWPRRQGIRKADRERLLSLLEARGALSLTEAQAILGGDARRVQAAIAALASVPGVPLVVDHARQRLLDPHCPGTHTQCAGCGGQADAGPQGLVCVQCGSVVVGIRPLPTPPAPDRGARAAHPPPTAAAPLQLWVDVSEVCIGEAVTGGVEVGFGGPRRCEGVRLRLVHRLRGTGKDDVWTIAGEQLVLQHHEVLTTALVSFRFPVPLGVVSYSGRLVTSEWWVAATLLGDDHFQSQDLQVRPAPQSTPEVWKYAATLEAEDRWEAWSDAFWIYGIGVGLIGLPCVAVVVAGLIGAVSAVLQGGDTLWAGLGGLLFLGLVIVGAWEGMRELAQGMVARLLLGGRLQGPTVAALGETLVWSFVPRGAPSAVEYRLLLVENNGTTVKYTRKGTEHTRTDWMQQRVRFAEGLWPEDGRLELVLPAGGPSSVPAGLRQYDWVLEVVLRRGGMVRTFQQSLLVLPVQGRLSR